MNKLLGHPGMELALVKLYRHTHEPAYLKLAERLIDARGRRSAALKRDLVRDGASPFEAKQGN